MKQIVAHFFVRTLVVSDGASHSVVKVGRLDKLLGGVDFSLLYERRVIEQCSQQRLQERDLLRLCEVFRAEKIVEPVEHLLERDHLGITFFTGTRRRHAGQADSRPEADIDPGPGQSA